MCCFTGPVDSVSATKIFARSSKGNRQFLVYSMTYAAKRDLAMVLPLPVPKNSPEDAVAFINLEKYPEFFRDMNKGFPQPRFRKPTTRSAGGNFGGVPETPLKVVPVGNFEASFVPKLADFARLDERFRLPNNIWDRVPSYNEFGFGVFKLKSGNLEVHPIAFEFPRSDADVIFFPTVHIHDGEVHRKADFDHDLFLQGADAMRLGNAWQESPQLAGQFMNVAKAKDVVAKSLHCYKRRIVGEHENSDTLVWQ